MEKPIVSIIMGSKSDLPTLKHAATVLEEFQIPHEIKIVSAHRTPDLMFDFGKKALSRGIKVIIAGAGGAAHLPGMIASNTVIPIIGVPVKTSSLSGVDSLLSIVQMPKGVPVATVAIGSAGATNAGLLAAQILGLNSPKLQSNFIKSRKKTTNEIEKESNINTNDTE